MQTTRSCALALSVVILGGTGGCASYRVSSNVEGGAPPAAAAKSSVLVAEDHLPGRKYTEIGPVEVSVKKLTVFHNNPTKEQANEALIEKARVLGADAVVNVKYDFGIGWTTWGYMDANGTAVRFVPVAESATLRSSVGAADSGSGAGLPAARSVAKPRPSGKANQHLVKAP